MGKKAIYKYFSFMLLVVTLLMTIFTILGIFGGHADPTVSTALAMIVYVLPFLILGDIVLLIIWLIKRRWLWATMPALALLCSINYMGTIYQPQLFSSGKGTSHGLNVATYNVAAFGREASGFKAEDILSEMKKQQVDILCMQEYLNTSGDKLNSDSYKVYFKHMAVGRNDMVIYSRYPIKETKTIDFGPGTNNSAMWADVDVNGKTIRVVNAHLETTGFNRTLYHAAKNKVQGIPIQENALIRSIYGNYTMGMTRRAGQAKMVAEEINKSVNPVIVCGDFNDVPYSYVYNMMLGNLSDGFKECGEGLMNTFRGKKAVRIDYIFHDKSLIGKRYYKKELSYSDHYPVFMQLHIK